VTGKDTVALGSGGTRRLYVDLGAERTLAAERDGRRIAIEIQSFLGDSEVENLHHAVGQYCVYRVLLNRTEANRELYLAVSQEAYNEIPDEPIGRAVVADLGIRLLIFDPVRRRVIEWRS
jgi:hypothetical protein